MVATWAYSTPKQGGQLHWQKHLDEMYPLFFARMSKVRSTMSSILLALDRKCSISISPIAANIQAIYNYEAREHCFTKNANLKDTRKQVPDSDSEEFQFRENYLEFLKKQVVYSFVAYTVGNHKDVTQNNCARELIECKACIRWPQKSVLLGANAQSGALGRGGAGPGKFTVMIVDHPKKKIKIHKTTISSKGKVGLQKIPLAGLAESVDFDITG
jgi:hypothetical protein